MVSRYSRVLVPGSSQVVIRIVVTFVNIKYHNKALILPGFYWWKLSKILKLGIM